MPLVLIDTEKDWSKHSNWIERMKDRFITCTRAHVSHHGHRFNGRLEWVSECTWVWIKLFFPLPHSYSTGGCSWISLYLPVQAVSNGHRHDAQRGGRRRRRRRRSKVTLTSAVVKTLKAHFILSLTAPPSPTLSCHLQILDTRDMHLLCFFVPSSFASNFLLTVSVFLLLADRCESLTQMHLKPIWPHTDTHRKRRRGEANNGKEKRRLRDRARKSKGESETCTSTLNDAVRNALDSPCASVWRS